MNDNPHGSRHDDMVGGPADTLDERFDDDATLRERVVRTGRRLSRRVEAVGSETKDLRRQVLQLQNELTELEAQFRQLQAEVHQDRRLHRRLAELTDVVAELLLPATQRDEEKLVALLEGYGGT